MVSRETLRLARSVGMDNVRVWLLPVHLRGEYFGQADAPHRVVWLHPDAPLVTAAHEVAHLAAPGHGHDDVWREMFWRLAVDTTS